MKHLAVIGAGSWGTALALKLSSRFERITLWSHEAEIAAQIESTRENGIYLPGFRLPENVAATASLDEAAEGADLILGVMPSQHARAVYSRLRGSNAPVVSATKGLERGTLLRISEVIAEVLGPRPIAVLSGPTFAKEIARGDPAAIVVASSDEPFATLVQGLFSTPDFRLYRNSDVTGVEIGASLKNVIAIAAGVVVGLGLGHNTLAALVTRGLAEITRLAVAAGGTPQTLAGLAGLGDLVLTCTGDLSRNRRVGFELAAGRRLAEIVQSMRMVAEGVETTAAAVAMARKLEVDLPITTKMDEMLNKGLAPQAAIRDLMVRSLKGE